MRLFSFLSKLFVCVCFLDCSYTILDPDVWLFFQTWYDWCVEHQTVSKKILFRFLSVHSLFLIICWSCCGWLATSSNRASVGKPGVFFQMTALKNLHGNFKVVVENVAVLGTTRRIPSYVTLCSDAQRNNG